MTVALKKSPEKKDGTASPTPLHKAFEKSTLTQQRQKDFGRIGVFLETGKAPKLSAEKTSREQPIAGLKEIPLPQEVRRKLYQ